MIKPTRSLLGASYARQRIPWCYSVPEHHTGFWIILYSKSLNLKYTVSVKLPSGQPCLPRFNLLYEWITHFVFNEAVECIRIQRFEKWIQCEKWTRMIYLFSKNKVQIRAQHPQKPPKPKFQSFGQLFLIWDHSAKGENFDPP